MIDPKLLGRLHFAFDNVSDSLLEDVASTDQAIMANEESSTNTPLSIDVNAQIHEWIARVCEEVFGETMPLPADAGNGLTIDGAFASADNLKAVVRFALDCVASFGKNKTDLQMMQLWDLVACAMACVTFDEDACDKGGFESKLARAGIARSVASEWFDHLSLVSGL